RARGGGNAGRGRAAGAVCRRDIGDARTAARRGGGGPDSAFAGDCEAGAAERDGDRSGGAARAGAGCVAEIAGAGDFARTRASGAGGGGGGVPAAESERQY